MKKLILILLIICMTAFCFCSPAFADMQAEVDNDTSRVTINITLEDAANQKTAIEVFKPGKGEADIASLTPENIAEVYSHVREVTADASGKISFGYKLGNESGKYSIRVRVDGSDTVLYPDAFTYVSPSFENDFLSKFCDERISSLEKETLVESSAELIGRDLQAMEALTDVERIALVEFTGIDHSSLSSIFASWEVGICAMLIKKGADASIISDTIDKYSDSFGILCESFELYSTYFTEGEKTTLYGIIAPEAFESCDKFAQEFADKIFLYSVKNADNHLNIEDILRSCEEWLNEDFNDYYKLKNKKEVNLALMKGKYDTPAELCSDLHIKVKSVQNNTISGSGGSVSSAPTKGTSVNVQVCASVDLQTPLVPLDSVNNEKLFSDIHTVSWAQEAIYALRDAGIINGVSDTLFAPDSNVTREEFVKMLVCALFDTQQGVRVEFSDVSSSHWSYPYIVAAVDLGIVNGVSENEFGIGMEISRQDMAVMLARALDAVGIVLSSEKQIDFTDADLVSSYALNAVEAMAKVGIINGFEDGRFEPLGNATRAQAAKVIYETLKRGGVK